MVKIKQALVGAGVWLHNHETTLRLVTGVLVLLAVWMGVVVIQTFPLFFSVLAVFCAFVTVVYFLGSAIWGLIDS